MTSSDPRYRVQSVERALNALEVLAEAGREALPLSELARRLRMSKSSAFALLQTLAARNFVVQADESGRRRYRLGLALARLGDQVLSQITLLDVAMPTLRELTAETGWTSRVGVLDDGFAVVVGRVDAPGIVRFQSNLARRELPHCSALGKALLAELPEEAVRAIVARTGLPARTPHTITDVESLLRDLEVVRARQFAVDDEEDSEGVFCVGSSVFNHQGSCVGAVSITGLKLTVEDGSIDALGRVVRRHAQKLSADLGASATVTVASSV